MLLTITTTDEPATDLGFLLHKHPGPGAGVRVSVGTAHVFYPEADERRMHRRAAARGGPGRPGPRAQGPSGEGFALGQYVNDRPYAASSMLAVALKEVFRTALTGRCASPGAGRLAPSRSSCTSRRCRAAAGPTWCAGCSSRSAGRSRRPPCRWTRPFRSWGESRYLDVRLAGTVRLADALNHLYVLLPVLDDAKHYWVSTTRSTSWSARAATGWPGHPEKELITRRYLAHRRRLTRDALARLAEVDDTEPEDLDNALDGARIVGEPDQPVPLGEQRRGAVLAAVRAAGARRVGDFGCGEGVLVRDLLADRAIEQVVATDVSRAGAADRRAQAQAGPDERARSATGCGSSSPRSPTATTGWPAWTRRC